MLADWIMSGRLIDLILLLVAIEAVALTLWRRRAARPPFPAEILANLAAGAMLLLALRAALVSAGWLWIAVWMTLGLAAHIGNLALRLRSARQR